MEKNITKNEFIESADTIHGRLLESVHTSGYSMERACIGLEWLIEGNRWKTIGDGFDNIDSFLDTINLSQFKIAVDKRKKLSKKLDEMKATQRATAKALGVTPMTISRDVTNVTKEKNKSLHDKELENENVTNVTESILTKDPKEILKPVEKEIAKEHKKEEQRIKQANIIPNKIQDPSLYNKDFREVTPEKKIDLILTDPPYGIDFIKEWTKLGKWARENLKENGFLITYFGEINLPQFYNEIMKELKYYWTFCLIHRGNKQLINPRNIFCGWKPIILFQNGFKKIDISIEDIITGTGREKGQHEWQQAEEEIGSIINNFTNEGDLICDPFMGSGTILKKAKDMKRNILGMEIDKTRYITGDRKING